CERVVSEQFWEGDMDAGGTISQFKSWVEEGAKLLTMLVAEETSELISGGDVDDAGALILELYAAPGKKYDSMIKLLGKSKVGLALEKAGARNSRKDGDK